MTTALQRMRTDVSCDRVTEVTRVGSSIIVESYWRAGLKPTSGSSGASMARTHVRHGEHMTRAYTSCIPLPGMRYRTTVYHVHTV